MTSRDIYSKRRCQRVWLSLQTSNITVAVYTSMSGGGDVITTLRSLDGMIRMAAGFVRIAGELTGARMVGSE